jgi:hypothetical protein
MSVSVIFGLTRNYLPSLSTSSINFLPFRASRMLDQLSLLQK